jgi:hypothetical protein
MSSERSHIRHKKLKTSRIYVELFVLLCGIKVFKQSHVLQEMEWRYVPLPMATTTKSEKHGTIG